VALVLTSITSVQFGAALAATLFPLVGPVAVVALRSVTAAGVLVVAGLGAGSAAWRAAGWRVPVALGIVLAVMNTCVYEAADRLPLGVVITLELLGPLGVALAHSRRRRDLAATLAAGVGVVLLAWPAPGSGSGSATGTGAGPGPGPGAAGGGVDPIGIGLALVAALGWALYILLTRAVGRQATGSGLALASVVAALLVTPVAVAGTGTALLGPRVLLVGLAVGVLASAVPFSLDRLVLRRLPPGTFGVLMSINPAVATVAGLLVLHQTPGPAQLAGTALVAAASAASAAG
jgi:inner membrane transporter RhtA